MTNLSSSSLSWTTRYTDSIYGIRYRCIIHEHEKGDDERDRDGFKAALVYGDAIHFARIAYGDDHEITAEMLAFVRSI